MALDPQTQAKVVEHLDRKWRNRVCAACGDTNWELHGHITLILSDTPCVVALGGVSLPCVALACRNCGSTLLFNLVLAGIVSGAVLADAARANERAGLAQR